MTSVTSTKIANKKRPVVVLPLAKRICKEQIHSSETEIDNANANANANSGVEHMEPLEQSPFQQINIPVINRRMWAESTSKTDCLINQKDDVVQDELEPASLNPITQHKPIVLVRKPSTNNVSHSRVPFPSKPYTKSTLLPYEEWWRNYHMVLDYEVKHHTFDIPLMHVAHTVKGEQVELGLWLDRQIKSLLTLKHDRYDAMKRLADTGRLWCVANETRSVRSDESPYRGRDLIDQQTLLPNVGDGQVRRQTNSGIAASRSHAESVMLRRSPMLPVDVPAPVPETILRPDKVVERQTVTRRVPLLVSDSEPGDEDNSSSGASSESRPAPATSLSALESQAQGRRVVVDGRNPMVRGGRVLRVKRSPLTKVRVHKGSVVAYAFRRPGCSDNVLGIGQVIYQRKVANPQALDQKLWEVQQMRVQSISDCPSRWTVASDLARSDTRRLLTAFCTHGWS